MLSFFYRKIATSLMIPHSVVFQQITAPQPKLVIVFLILFVPNWLPTLLASALLMWPDFSTFVSEHGVSYRIIFFFVQISLTCGTILLVNRRYTSALWTPQPSWKHSITISALILLPLFLYHISSSISGLQVVISLSNFGDDGRDVIASIHDEVWSRVAYGSSSDGIVCFSVLSFVTPALEEVVFTGFVVNMIARPYGFAAAFFGASVCFGAVHVFQYGVGLHLIPLFFASITYASIRVCSGSLLLAVFGHCVINAVILLPKWLIAVMHFSQV